MHTCILEVSTPFLYILGIPPWFFLLPQAPTLQAIFSLPALCEWVLQRVLYVMQFGWLKENIEALAYWIWRHVRIRISPATLFYWLGEKGITSSSYTPPPPVPTPHYPAHPTAPPSLISSSHARQTLTGGRPGRTNFFIPQSPLCHLLAHLHISTLNNHKTAIWGKSCSPVCKLLFRAKVEHTCYTQ